MKSDVHDLSAFARVLVEPDGTVVEADRGVRGLLGYSPSEVEGVAFMNLLEEPRSFDVSMLVDRVARCLSFRHRSGWPVTCEVVPLGATPESSGRVHLTLSALTGDEQTEVVRRRLRRWERAWLALQAQVAADFRLLATAVRAMARCDSAGLTGVEARAVVMASVHENAARLGLDERVELGEHLTALCLDVQRHFGGAGGALVTCDFQRTFAPVETAARCALVVGEVLACALAAPPADSGATAVTLGLSQLNGLVSMRLSATRIGTTPVAAPRIELIRAVVERTGGIVDVGGGAHGVTLVVQFPSEVCA